MYALIRAERGYAGMSMLAVARAAGASNDTLYRWYDDKLGLLRAMIERNAGDVQAVMDTRQDAETTLEDAEVRIGRVLLRMLLGARAVALNKTAAADASGEPGAALAEGGRNVVGPRLAGLIGRYRGDGCAGADVFLRLLVGDWQKKPIIGQQLAPDETDIDEPLAEAVRLFCVLWRGEIVNKG